MKLYIALEFVSSPKQISQHESLHSFSEVMIAVCSSQLLGISKVKTVGSVKTKKLLPLTNFSHKTLYCTGICWLQQKRYPLSNGARWQARDNLVKFVRNQQLLSELKVLSAFKDSLCESFSM